MIIKAILILIQYLNVEVSEVLVYQIWLPLINWKQPFSTFFRPFRPFSQQEQEEQQEQQQQSDM